MYICFHSFFHFRCAIPNKFTNFVFVFKESTLYVLVSALKNNIFILTKLGLGQQDEHSH